MPVQDKESVEANLRLGLMFVAMRRLNEAYIHTYMPACIHTCIMFIAMRNEVRTVCTHVYTFASICTCTHTHVHVYAQPSLLHTPRSSHSQAEPLLQFAAIKSPEGAEKEKAKKAYRALGIMQNRSMSSSKSLHPGIYLCMYVSMSSSKSLQAGKHHWHC